MSAPDFMAVDEASFDREVTLRGGLTILEFWNEGCVPCKQLSRVLAELAPSLPIGTRIVTVDAARNPALAERFNVRAVPTLVFLKDGTVVDTRSGVDRRQVLKKIVEAYT